MPMMRLRRLCFTEKFEPSPSIYKAIRSIVEYQTFSKIISLSSNARAAYLFLAISTSVIIICSDIYANQFFYVIS